jgi:hypothetical protein
MSEPANAPPDPVNVRLAQYLCSRREAIILEWLDRVRADPKIPTDSMTTVQVKDHVPNLFDDLADTLRIYRSSGLENQAQKDCESHVGARWKEGYSLPELLREIKHLRTVLIYHLLAFEELNPDFGMVPRLFAIYTVHGFLDNMVIDATEEFLELERG